MVNFITAIGFAYKEFAIETIRALGIDECRDGLFNGITRDYSEEELTYKMGDDNFRQFLEEYNNYLMDNLE